MTFPLWESVLATLERPSSSVAARFEPPAAGEHDPCYSATSISCRRAAHDPPSGSAA